MKKRIALLLCILLLTGLAGCSAGTPVQEPTFTPTAQTESANVVEVETVDELLAALAPGAHIRLAPGEYSLHASANYGKAALNPYYLWENMGRGEYELRLQYLEDVIIEGAGKDKTTIATAPRSVHVLSLTSCENVTLQGMTLGHSHMAAACEGGVVNMIFSKEIRLEELGLFGCGSIGTQIYDSEDITVDGCEIYDCSICAVSVSMGRDVTVRGCTIRDLGDELPVSGAINLWDGENILVEDCLFINNYVDALLDSLCQGTVTLRNNHFQGNRVTTSALRLWTEGVVMDNNVFEENVIRSWLDPNSFPPVDSQGQVIEFAVQSGSDHVGTAVAVPVDTGEQKEIRVSNVDAFLDAIGSNTRIILDTKLLDLSKASNYGTGAGVHYYWEEGYDGPGLVITGVENMTIMAEGEDRTAHTISALPRYANVLTFENCTGITLRGFTAGHTVEPGYCMGGVVLLRECTAVLVENCGLFGCGTIGVAAEACGKLQVINCEIYECSYYGISLSGTSDVTIAGTLIRDIGDEYSEGCAFSFCDSWNITLDGFPIDGNYMGN